MIRNFLELFGEHKEAIVFIFTMGLTLIMFGRYLLYRNKFKHLGETLHESTQVIAKANNKINDLTSQLIAVNGKLIKAQSDLAIEKAKNERNEAEIIRLEGKIDRLEASIKELEKGLRSD
ncbi:MAG: hypothetical protein AAFU67_01535 [Bacteroidota bacterium]